MATITSVSVSPGAASKTRAYVGGNTPGTERFFQIDLDSSYPTGGEDIGDMFDFFRGDPWFISVEGRGARLFEVDRTTQKLKVYTAIGTEATNGSNQSSIADLCIRMVGAS